MYTVKLIGDLYIAKHEDHPNLSYSDETPDGAIKGLRNYIESSYVTFTYDTTPPIEYYYDSTPVYQDPCLQCSNHPSNGGSGICHCILGMGTVWA